MYSFSQWFITEAVPAFSRTLLHSLWQGLMAAILAGIVIATTRKSPATKRYNGLVAVYALFLITVALTFFYEIGTPAQATTASVTSVAQSSPVVIIGNLTTAEVMDQHFGSSLLAAVNRNAALLVGLWTVLFLAQLIRMAFGLRHVQTISKQGTQAVAAEWSDWLEKASRRLHITQTVLLLQSERVKVPVALGFLKPVILVPIGLMTHLNTQQVEAILLHELAHIRRKDYLVNLLQSFADAVFFFNPAVRWISARIREERETCCDNMVVQHTANKKGYVEALVSFSQLPLSPSYAMAIGSNKTHLLNRVKTIITRENSRLSAREQAALLLGIVVMLAFGILAFKPKEKEMKKEAVIEKKLPVLTKNIPPADQPKRLKKINTTKPLQHRVDTVPPPVVKKATPMNWKNMSTNINDDGEGKATQIIATAEDGTVYRIRKTNDEIVLLSVNGQEISKENYPQYYSIIEAIEQTRNQRTANVQKAQEQRVKARLQREEKLQQVHEYLQQKQEVLKKQLAAGNMKKQADRAGLLNKLEYLKQQEQKQQLYNQKKQLFKPQKDHLNSNSTLSAIIADLLANKLAENETKLSFTLTNTELVVNGKAVDQGLFEIFRKKYIKSSGDSYSYFRDGGTTRTTINVQ